jgi:hypothetical protein
VQIIEASVERLKQEMTAVISCRGRDFFEEDTLLAARRLWLAVRV